MESKIARKEKEGIQPDNKKIRELEEMFDILQTNERGKHRRTKRKIQ